MDTTPPANTDEAVEASASVPLILAAARAAVLVPGNMAAEEVAVLHPTSADVAVQVALLVPPIPAAQASHPIYEGHCGDHHSVPAATRDDPPKHGAQVLFCPDSQYLTEGQRIPQLDGSKDAISSIQCDALKLETSLQTMMNSTNSDVTTVAFATHPSISLTSMN